MRKFSALPPAARAYVAAVVCVGLAVAVHSILTLTVHPIRPEWFVLAALTLLTGSFTVKVPSITARLTVSETFVFASVLLFGVAAGTVTVVLETVVVALWVRRESRSLYRALFNVAASSLSIWLAATIFFWLSGLSPLANKEVPIGALFIPLLGMTTAYFASNSWLVAFAVGLERTRSPLEIWWNNFTWLSVNYFSGASVAVVIVTYTSKLEATALIGSLVIIVPLLLVSYLTFRTAMGRVEDTNQHLSELNRLYLSTIETLAMAIDAKDQITHGHIRRVQSFAVALATRIGITEEKLIKAIEAAALLHDMGKLAVPEYILNKPGKLTAAEFEKMKLHAAVGADILSAIQFPYPVVPIVRHHHENWDGTGYPDGLRGTDIPIGARILSVVDCFDALTSDRPYRPRLSDEDALSILCDRRGTMYDPLIVDAFIRCHSEITPEFHSTGLPRPVLGEMEASSHLTPVGIESDRLEDIAASADEMQTLYELARGLSGHVTVSSAGDFVARQIRRLVPWALIAFYAYDTSRDDLVALHCVGHGSSIVKGLRIPLGQRLSGWVAANRQTIVNSDAVLDLGDMARSHTPKLRTCISTPLLANDALVGVLSLYSTESSGFSQGHRRIVEAVASQVVHTLKSALDNDGTFRTGSQTTLPGVDQLQHLVNSASMVQTPGSGAPLLLRVQVVGIKAIIQAYGPHSADEVLHLVATQAKNALRLGDAFFKCSSDELVVLLQEADETSARILGDRIRRTIATDVFSLSSGESISVDVRVTLTPATAESVAALRAASSRTPDPAHGSIASVH